MPNGVIIGPVRLSYMHLIKPQVDKDSGKKKFNSSCILPKKNKKMIAKLEEWIEEAYQEGVDDPKIFGGKAPKKWTNPLKDGDDDKDDEAYEGAMYFSTSSMRQPGFLDAEKEEIFEDNLEEEIYSGCWVYLAANVKPFKSPDGTNKGVSIYVNHVLKYKDDENLGGGGGSASDAFADFEAEQASKKSGTKKKNTSWD